MVKRHGFYDQKLDGIKFRLDNWEIQLFGSTKERKELRTRSLINSGAETVFETISGMLLALLGGKCSIVHSLKSIRQVQSYRQRLIS